MRKSWKALQILLVSVMYLALSGFISYGGEEGTWELQEDGKRWKYLYSPGVQAEDEWIESDGKEYYLDSKGYMKTGWVWDKEEGKRYYMGLDGAKCFNLFTPDGHYVGPEGTVLEKFDTYRQKVSKGLEVFFEKDKGGTLAGEEKGFLLLDLNGDGYKDVTVLDSPLLPSRVLWVAVWSPAEEKLVHSAEMDSDSQEESCITYNPETQSFWLTIQEDSGAKSYFVMEEGGSRFENVWSFQIEYDEWGDSIHYINGKIWNLEEWEGSLKTAEVEAGSPVNAEIVLLNTEMICQEVERVPSAEELVLWETP